MTYLCIQTRDSDSDGGSGSDSDSNSKSTVDELLEHLPRLQELDLEGYCQMYAGW